MKTASQSKIIILSWECYPIYLGGLGVLVQSLATEIEAQHRDIEVWIPHNADGYDTPDYVRSLYTLTESYKTKKARVNGIDLPLSFPPRAKKETWPKLFTDFQQSNTSPQSLYNLETFPGDFMAFAHAVRDTLKQEEVEPIVICMDYHQVPAMKIIKDTFPDIKQIFYINSIEHDRKAGMIHTPSSQKVIPLELQGLKTADLSIAVSQITKDTILKHHDVDPNSIQVVYNDIDFDPEILPHHQIESGKNVLFIGRLSSQKGLGFLIDAAHHIREADNQVQFIIAGDGPLMPELMEKVAKKKLEKKIIFAGFVNTQEKKLLYRSCDIFVMPSPTEPFGLTALESIASGVPVIASKQCGFVGVVPSTPTFKYHDSERFMELLLFYINNPHERSGLLKQQQKDLEGHSWVKEVQTFLNSIDNI